MADHPLTILRELDPHRRAAVLDRMPGDALRWLRDNTPTHGTTDHPSPIALAETLDPLYARRTHLDALSDLVVRLDEQGGGRAIVNMPPQFGKSSLTSLWAPVWYVNRHPERHIAIVSHEQHHAIRWGRAARDAIAHNPDAFSVRLANVTAASEWHTTSRGICVSRGIRGSLTGRSAHLLVIDDPFSGPVEAHSRQHRDMVWDWWLSVARLRLQPGSIVLLVMTRWHEDDLAGRLLSDEWEGDPSEWETLRLAALAEPDDPLDRDEGDPLLRPQADQTPSDARTELEGIRTSIGPYFWSALFQQRPSEPEGSILKASWWQFYDRLPQNFDTVVHSWDMAFKATDSSSYVVGQVWGRTGADCWLLDQVRGRWNYPDTKRRVSELADRWPDYSHILIEEKANGPAVIDDLSGEVRGLVPRNPEGDKTQRAHGVSGTVEAGNVHLPSPEHAPWVREFVQECADFPHGAHDDQVDTMTQALFELRGAGPVEVSVPRGSRSGATARGSLPQTRRRITRSR
jgi:predicted phage terminase large subunit-like protein